MEKVKKKENEKPGRKQEKGETENVKDKGPRKRKKEDSIEVQALYHFQIIDPLVNCCVVRRENYIADWNHTSETIQRVKVSTIITWNRCHCERYW